MIEVNQLLIPRPQECHHFARGLFDPHKHRPRHNRVTDIQLDELGQGQDRLHIRVIQPMASIHLDAGVTREPGGLDQAAEFLVTGGAGSLGICLLYTSDAADE